MTKMVRSIYINASKLTAYAARAAYWLIWFHCMLYVQKKYIDKCMCKAKPKFATYVFKVIIVLASRLCGRAVL